MNISAIVCEYNPFHNGHLYQITKTKEAGADFVICVMSGNFVQRGAFAIMQKHARAEAAIRCGADIVFELPLPYCLSSAERFASGAISIIENIGVVSTLSFGVEDEKIDELWLLAELLNSGELDSSVSEEYSRGVSYAVARENAISKKNKKLSKLIKKPNNILAVEYLKALLRLDSKIEPLAISRVGAEHDGNITSSEFASASHIRSLIYENKNADAFIPKPCLEIYRKEVLGGFAPINLKVANLSVIAALKRLSPEDFKKYADVSEGLENRLYDAVSKSTSLDEAIKLAKTKRYAESRLRRILMNAFLDVDADLSMQPSPYARVLAFSESGRSVLKKIKSASNIPIITKPASIKSESEPAKYLLALEKRADDIYSLFMKSPVSQGETFKKSPVFVSDK